MADKVINIGNSSNKVTVNVPGGEIVCPTFTGTATQVGHTLSFGNKTFNGSTNVTLYSSDLGAVDLTSEQTIIGQKTFSGETYLDSLNANQGVISGHLRVVNGITGNLTGNASTATNVSWSGITGKQIANSTILGIVKEGSSDTANKKYKVDIASDGGMSVTVPWTQSGGNADTVDNEHASAFVHIGNDETITGNKTFTGNILIGAEGAGGVIYGNATNGGCNLIRIGDNVYLGDVNASGIMGMKSTGTNTGFKFLKSDGTSIGGIQSTNGVLQWQNSSGTFYNIYHTGNLSPMTTSHAANEITSTNISNWNAVHTWYTTVTATNTDSVIDTWEEIKAFVSGYTTANNLQDWLSNNYLAKATAKNYVVTLGDVQTISGNKTFTSSVSIDSLTAGNLQVTGTASFNGPLIGNLTGNADTASSVAWTGVTGKPNFVNSFGTKTGDITVRGGQTANGSVNLVMSNNELQASIVGLGSNAFSSTEHLPSFQVSADQTDASWAKTTATSTRRGFIYNTRGIEYSYLFGFSNSSSTSGGAAYYGAVLRMGHADNYLRMLRVNEGKWQTDNWEKISAGYADSAGYATSAGTATDNTKLPLTGGTITNTNSSVPLTIVGKEGYSAIKFQNSQNPAKYRIFGLKGDGTLFVTNESGWSNEYNILDSSNSSVSLSGSTLSVKINGTTYSLTNTDSNVTQTVTNSGNTDYRPVILGASFNGSTNSFSTTTSSVYAAANVYIKPDNGNLYTKGALNASTTISSGTSISAGTTVTAATSITSTAGDFYVGGTSGSRCHLKMDTTNKCVQFIFD